MAKERKTLLIVKMKKLYDSAREVTVKGEVSKEEFDFAQRQVTALSVVFDYLENPYSLWTTDTKIKAIFRGIIQLGSVDKAGEKLGISRNTAYRMAVTGDKVLPYRIGVMTFDKISRGQIRQAMYEFSNTAKVEVPGLISLSARQMVESTVKPTVELDSVDIRGVENELRWLRAMNLIVMQDGLSEVSVDKVARILEILTNEDEKYNAVRAVIQRYLDAKDDILFECLRELDDVLLFM